MADAPIQLPLVFDLAATFVSAVSGALAAARRRYDAVGVFALAFVTGLGGALIRDGIFLGAGPPAAVRDSRYLAAVLLATLAGVGIDRLGSRLNRAFLLLDAVGLGAYAVVGADRALAAGLGHLGAILVGVTNAVGGGVLRREEPLLFKPGQFYATAALVGAGVYVGLWEAGLHPPAAAGAGAAAGILLRLLALRFDWQTRPLYRHYRKQLEEPKG